MEELVAAVEPMRFKAPVTHVYNPLVYARDPHVAYLRRYGRERREVLLLGMNPGPFGMAQTGVPFGEVNLVRDWLGIEAAVGRPRREHPKRPIQGFGCTRSEVSGARLWGWARSRFREPQRFFARFFVVNYCPLVFLEESGRNRTPDRLPAKERDRLLDACDVALQQTVDALCPRIVVGVGKFAENRARAALADRDVAIGGMLHPSPASPAANRGWEKVATRQLAELGIDV
ncbi:MAG TPA: single-stranded DNA-binding protein [Phycisphaerae bacterium]|nr:single-stranded DNA-binding protein [Phycisphaerae bacterium]